MIILLSLALGMTANYATTGTADRMGRMDRMKGDLHRRVWLRAPAA
jgi:hypothetical protein